MVVAYPESHFKPEYILPQIILEWTRKRIKIGNDKRRVIGVTYSSSKVPIHKKGYYGLFHNTAIPVDNAGDIGYCDSLRNLFRLTAPLSFERALSMEVEAEQDGQVKSILDLWHNEIEYIKTGFGKIETILRKSPHLDL